MIDRILSKALGMALSPMMVLNWVAGVVAGVWLIALGAWGPLTVGLIAVFVAALGLGVVMLPGGLLAGPAVIALQKRRLMAGTALCWLSWLYYGVVITAWLWGVAYHFLSTSDARSLLPLAIWSYAVGAAPLSMMARGDDSKATGLTLATSEVGFLLFLVSFILFHSILGGLIAFCLVVFLNGAIGVAGAVTEARIVGSGRRPAIAYLSTALVMAALIGGGISYWKNLPFGQGGVPTNTLPAPSLDAQESRLEAIATARMMLQPLGPADIDSLLGAWSHCERRTGRPVRQSRFNIFDLGGAYESELERCMLASLGHHRAIYSPALGKLRDLMESMGAEGRTELDADFRSIAGEASGKEWIDGSGHAQAPLDREDILGSLRILDQVDANLDLIARRPGSGVVRQWKWKASPAPLGP